MQKQMLQQNKKTGFTLLEILLVMAIFSILAGLSAPVLMSFSNRNDLDIAVNHFVSDLKRASALSRASDGDSSWGVYVSEGSVVIFKGSSYAARDSAFDEVTDIANSIQISDTGQYVFSKFSGIPTSVGTTTFLSVNNDERVVVVNSKGMVDYE